MLGEKKSIAHTRNIDGDREDLAPLFHREMKSIAHAYNIDGEELAPLLKRGRRALKISPMNAISIIPKSFYKFTFYTTFSHYMGIYNLKIF